MTTLGNRWEASLATAWEVQSEPWLVTPRFSDSSLAIGGSLAMRLRTDLKHRPAPERKPRSKCQLHRWASGLEFRAGPCGARIARCIFALAASAPSMTSRISSKTKSSLTLIFRNKILQSRQRGRPVSWLILPHKWLEFERTRQQQELTNGTDS